MSKHHQYFFYFNSGKEINSSSQILISTSNVFINLRWSIQLLLIVPLILLCYTGHAPGSVIFLLQATMCCAFCHVIIVCVTGKHLKSRYRVLFKENVRYLVLICRDPISLILGTQIGSLKHLKKPGRYIIIVLVCVKGLRLFLLHQKLMWMSTFVRNCFLFEFLANAAFPTKSSCQFCYYVQIIKLFLELEYSVGNSISTIPFSDKFVTRN